ncbi:hypothetical protein OH799_01045 [Nocardia sp. NBC_00881]|nr:hypothetical protein OH799_01045 [Nocardia sp. NBC_00881]
MVVDPLGIGEAGASRFDHDSSSVVEGHLDIAAPVEVGKPRLDVYSGDAGSGGGPFGEDGFAGDVPWRFELVLEACRRLAWRMREVGRRRPPILPRTTAGTVLPGCASMTIQHSAHTSVLSPV